MRVLRAASLLLFCLLVAPVTVEAANIHPLLGTYIYGANLKPPAEGTRAFDAACGLAVDSEGHVYVSDYQHDLIGIFAGGAEPTQTGRYLTQIPSGSEPENSACELAVDSAGNVYADNWHQSVVRYTPSAYPFPFESFPSYSAAAPIEAGRATGVAVDPATDVVYVAHRTHVAAFEPDGSPVLAEGSPLRIGEGSLGDAYGLAVSRFAATSGYVYVGDAAGDTVKVFDPATDPASPVAVIDGAGAPQGGFRDLADTDLAIDEGNGHLFVVDNLESGFEHPVAVVDEFDASGAYLGQLPRQLVSAQPTAVAVDNSVDPESGKRWGSVYVTSGNEVGSTVYRFCPADPIDPLTQAACAGSSVPTGLLSVGRGGDGLGTVAEAGGAIDCGRVCAWEFDLGRELTLTARPRPHSAFAGWTVAGQPAACPGLAPCKLTLGGDAEVSAEFRAIPQQRLSVSRAGAGSGAVTSAPGGIDCGSVCAGAFDRGSSVTLTASPAPRSRFAGWSGGGCSGTGLCQVALGADAEVSAIFEPVDRPAPPFPGLAERILSVSVLGAGSGTIASAPGGLECGAPCSGVYAAGTAVSLTATAGPESAFAGWSGCDTAKGLRCNVTLATSRTVTASFAEAKPKKKQCGRKKAGKRGRKAKCKAAGKGKRTAKKGRGQR